MINVNGLMKVKSNFPVMVGKGIISKKDCDKLINEIKNANAFDDLIQGGRNRINKGSSNFKNYLKMKDVFTVKRSADGDDVLKKLNNPFVNVITTGDANYALEDIESGYVIVEAAATEARTITLPAPSSGLYFKVIWGIASDAAETIITAKAAPAKSLLNPLTE